MRSASISSVFDHEADPSRVDKLRHDVAHDIALLHSKYPKFTKLTSANFAEADYAEMKEKYAGLYYGSFGLTGKKSLANELIWKWTEATGKYVGCQYWSVGAKDLFERELQLSHAGWPMTKKAAEDLARILSKKARPKGSKLTHEHVYPIKDLKLWLDRQENPGFEDIRNRFDSHCISCVVLESEHNRSSGNDENPWLRYKECCISLAWNPAWPEIHNRWIREAGILRDAR